MSGRSFDWASRRVLVTGATGFVGSWLVNELLERGAQVVALIRDVDYQSELVRRDGIRKVTVVSGCVEDYRTVERAINEHETDTVFHLAAQALVGAALRSPLQTFEANIRGTYHVLEACRVHSSLVQRVIVASSDKAYGDTEDLPYTEHHPLIGRHPYDVSKSCADLLATSYYHTYATPVAVARCGNIYGGGDLNWSRIVPGTIRSFFRRERPIVRSDGSFVRDYFYVEDAVAGYISLAEQISRPDVVGQAFNFSTESSITVREIVQTIQSEMGAHDLAPIVQAQARGEIRHQSLSAGRVRKVLGWTPGFNLSDGLTKTVAWYQRYLESVA
jgi:CDP-glucose 4,6-dehydratase